MTSFLDTLEASAKGVLATLDSKDDSATSAAINVFDGVATATAVLALVRVAREAMAQRTANEEGYCTTYDLDEALDALPQ